MKLLFIATLLFSVPGIPTGNPFEKDQIKINFAKTFPGVTNVVWVQEEENVKAVVEQEEIKTHITYNPDGTVEKCIRYYSCKDLPAHIRARVFEKYPDGKILGVTETFEDNAMNYYIHIKNEENLIQLQADPSGQLSKLSSVRDGSPRKKEKK